MSTIFFIIKGATQIRYCSVVFCCLLFYFLLKLNLNPNVTPARLNFWLNGDWDVVMFDKLYLKYGSTKMCMSSLNRFTMLKLPINPIPILLLYNGLPDLSIGTVPKALSSLTPWYQELILNTTPAL